MRSVVVHVEEFCGEDAADAAYSLLWKNVNIKRNHRETEIRNGMK